MVGQIQIRLVHTGCFLGGIAHVHDQAQQVTAGILPNRNPHVQANAVVHDVDVFFDVPLNRQAAQHQKTAAIFKFLAVQFQIQNIVSQGEIVFDKVRKIQPLGLDMRDGRFQLGNGGIGQVMHPRCVALQLRQQG